MSLSEDDVIGPSSPKQEMMLATATDVAIWGGSAGCLDGEAEFLSRDGWVKISEYCDQEVAVWEEGKGVFFEPPRKFIKTPSKYLIQLDSAFSSYRVSEEHILPVIDNDKLTAFPVWGVMECIKRYGFFESTILSSDDGKSVYEKPVRFTNEGLSKVSTSDGFQYCFKVSTGFFLVRDRGNIYITGNSGKSYMALLYPLKFIDDPWFRGIIFRKTNAELKAQGGLWENAQDIYSRVFGLENLRIQQNELKITFPSGATLKFSYLENDGDCLKHQGAQYSFVLFDEGSHFTKYQVEYLSGRIRSSRAKHHKQMILTCNPDPDWFALDWIMPYLTDEGIPDPNMDGVTRYYVVDSNTYVWSDSREDLRERYPNLGTPRSFTFISANCHDNVPLLKADPEYPSRLMALDWVDMQRLYLGNWFVRPSTSGYFKRDWVEELRDFPPKSDIEKIVRAYDLAGTLKSDSNPDPDYTASAKVAKLRSGDYVILEVCRIRARYGDVARHIIENAQSDGKGVDILIPTDPGAAGKAAARMLIKEIAEAGFYATTRATSANKIDRFRPFSAAAQAGIVKVLHGCATDLENGVYGDNSFFYSELEQFTGGRKGHDDMVDACGDAFMALATKYTLPDISLSLMPDLSTISPIR